MPNSANKTTNKSSVIPLKEYPRPQFIRQNYCSLNGEWEYGIGLESPDKIDYQGRIVVPFSPECTPGIDHILQPKETLVYHTRFRLPESFENKQVLLRFLAVDQVADVYLNDHYLGHHIGGFLPFDFEIGPFIKEVNDLKVVVKDETDHSFHAIGKQHLNPTRIWYAPQSGIWLPVYLEAVPQNYVTDMKITPHFDERIIEIMATSNVREEIQIKAIGKVFKGFSNEPLFIDAKELEPWSPDHPKLYEFILSMGDDVITSYFALRKISLMKDERGFFRVALNNEFIFLNGVLDQGYWPKTLLTPPNDESYIKDINSMKEMGFNLLRKHAKIESPRFYYHCDRIGMLVMQDIVNGGAPYKTPTIIFPLFTHRHKNDTKYGPFSRKDVRGRIEFNNEVIATSNHLYNSPSIIAWTLFNEGWGQFNALKETTVLKDNDPTRLIDHASGWHDQGGGDFLSEHVYFHPFDIPDNSRFNKRALLLSEFGGYALDLKDGGTHHKFGYKFFKNSDELSDGVVELYKRDVIAHIKDGLSGSVYTQVCDVEGELNGLLSYDRQEHKVAVDVMKNISKSIQKKFASTIKHK